MYIDYEILDSIREKYGDAFYLLDSKQFKENYIELKKTFLDIYPNFNIAYSYKTNYIPQICRIVKDLDGYAEVVSEMELELALKIGVEYSKIIWNGPIKNSAIMRSFLLSGGTINIDSTEELKIVQEISKENQNTNLNLGIRCNYDVKDGIISRFGLDVNSEEFINCLNIIKNTPNMHLINLQCHFAKRQIKYWSARVNGMLNLIEKLGIIPDRIDLGGGLFGKMEEKLKKQFSDKIPTYKDYANIVAVAFNNYFIDKEKKPELIIEPGSALVGDCMKFIATIKSIKKIRNKTFATVLGSQKNISMSGINPPMTVYSNVIGKKYKNVDIVGFTCIESDVLYKDYCGQLAVGDFIVISNCGSYSIVMKPPFILPNFAILDISNQKEELIKRAETFEDVFHTFLF